MFILSSTYGVYMSLMNEMMTRAQDISSRCLVVKLIHGGLGHQPLPMWRVGFHLVLIRVFILDRSRLCCLKLCLMIVLLVCGCGHIYLWYRFYRLFSMIISYCWWRFGFYCLSMNLLVHIISLHQRLVFRYLWSFESILCNMRYF